MSLAVAQGIKLSELNAVKSIASVMFAVLLAGAVFAQATPPADPPKDPPPADPPKDPPPVEPPPATTDWAKTWQGARDLAAKRNGYAIMFVTMNKLADGSEAPNTAFLLDQFFGREPIYRILNEQFGCWKGDLAACRVQGGKHLTDAEVNEAPAILFVEPSNGELLDAYVGRCNFMELEVVMNAVNDGNHRKGLEKKLADKENQGNTRLQFLYGEALLRARQIPEARKAYAVSKQSRDMKERMNSQIGLVWCDLRDKKYKEAIEGAQKALEELPEFALEPRGTCTYIQMWAYYLQNEMEECSKVALELREKYIRTTYGFKMDDDVAALGYDFIRKLKFTPGEKPPPEEPK
ncbi:MAG: hypothetical protein FD180_1358 [Planctomycetota bacterium]|nr:MAG: hypothetical protein FD180_1358 [Planctomycetota bacterium]